MFSFPILNMNDELMIKVYDENLSTDDLVSSVFPDVFLLNYYFSFFNSNLIPNSVIISIFNFES